MEVVEWRTHENKWEDVAAQAGLTRHPISGIEGQESGCL
jgi:hypothetical protein